MIAEWRLWTLIIAIFYPYDHFADHWLLTTDYFLRLITEAW